VVICYEGLSPVYSPLALTKSVDEQSSLIYGRTRVENAQQSCPIAEAVPGKSVANRIESGLPRAEPTLW
jgi:hypothetical protein